MSARLALASVRHRRGTFVGTFLTAFLAIALLAAAGLLLWSVLTAGPGADRFAQADAVASGPRSVEITTTVDKGDKVKTKTKSERLTGAAPMPAGLTSAIADVPGVDDVVADHAFPATLAAGATPVTVPDAVTVAHGWSSAALTPYPLLEGVAPGAGEAVVQRELAAPLGSTVQLTTRAGTHELRVVGVVGGGVPGQAAVFVADSQVQALSGLTGPTAIAFRATPDGVRGASEAVGDAATVHTGGDKVTADLPGAVPDYVSAVSVFGFTIGITGFAAVFVLTGTISLGVRLRLRELALLRTVGATPRQLHRLLRTEATVVSLIAAVPAAPAGVVIAEILAARFRDLGAVPPQFAVSVNVLVLVAAAGAGLGAAVVATWFSARRAVRIAPTQALQESVTAGATGWLPRALAAGILTAGAAAVLTFVPLGGQLGMGMVFVSTALLLCATAAVGPILVGALVAALSRLSALAGPLGRTAGAMARAETLRVVGVVVPMTLMLALNASMLLSGEIQSEVTADQQASRTAPATLRVASAPGSGLPLQTAREVAELPEVTGAAATMGTRVVVVDDGGKPEDYAAQGLWTSGERSLDLDVTAGELDELAPDAVAVSEPLARAHGWAVGDRPTFWLADGTRAELTVVATYASWRGFGDLVLPAELAAAHDPRGLVGTMYLRGGPEAAAAVSDGWPTLVATDAADPRAGAADLQNQQAAWELMVVISLGFTSIAVVNTFAVATNARRRELGDLRLAGATPRQVHRLLGHEALLAVAVAVVIGCVVSGAVVGTFSVAQDGRWRLFAEPGTIAALLAGVGTPGLLAGAVPARMVVRRHALPVASD